MIKSKRKNIQISEYQNKKHSILVVIGNFFKNNWLGIIVGGIVVAVVGGSLVIVIAPHLSNFWPVNKPVIISVSSTDYSVPQATPPLNGVFSDEVSVANYRIGEEVDGSATIYSNQSIMTSYYVSAVIPDSATLRDGYSIAPIDISNWVTFSTGNTVLVEPNSKATVKIVFKIPSGYKNNLPKKWQFNISVLSQPNFSDTSNITSNGVTFNIQTQELFRWLISMT
jgi:hypothetical protein